MRKILLTRDPVCMADDCEDNILEIEVNEDWKITEILTKILSIGYLPRISGGKATWSVSYDNPLAIVAQQWGKPKIMSTQFPFSISNKYKGFNRLHFNYHAQNDPDLVFEIISRFKTAL